MKLITLISGSTLGGAEYVAEHLAEKLNEYSFSTQVLHGPELVELPYHGLWLLVASTHGAGELPDNLKPLIEQIQSKKPNLNQVQYGAIGLGNSSYDTFCEAIKLIDRTLYEAGAQKIGDRLEIDVSKYDIPEAPAEQWLDQWVRLIHN